jgi:uncharacterized protein (DUF433 family)
MRYERITIDSRQMAGVPCIRGLRIPVSTVVEMISDGMTQKDIREALRYAAEAVTERQIPLLSAA